MTPEAVAVLTKERADYDAIVNTPDVVAAVRKALTKGLPQAFALVENKFGELDSPVAWFGRTDGGGWRLENDRHLEGRPSSKRPAHRPGKEPLVLDTCAPAV